MEERFDDSAVRYRVVVNDEEQYSIWVEDRDNPRGWRSVGVVGTKDECLAHIREVWTDLRQKGLGRASGFSWDTAAHQLLEVFQAAASEGMPR